MEVKELLETEIRSELSKLETMKVGSDEYNKTIEGIAKLIDKANDLDKVKHDKKDRIVQYIMTGAGILIPAVITIWGTVVSLRFESTGTVTTIAGRGFINKLLPKK